MSLKFDKVREASERQVDVVFPPDEGDDDPFIITFNVLTPKKLDVIQEKHTKYKWRQNQKVKDIKEREVLYDVIDEAIHDWRGITENENPWPCTKENKIELMEKTADVSDWIVTTIQDLSETAETSKKLEQKNLKAS